MKYSEQSYQHYCPAADSGSPRDEIQPLASEVAVGISYNGLNHAVMMATPDDLDDFALGFSFTSGIIEQREQILDVELITVEEGVLLEITLSQRALNRLKHQRRTMTGTSGCGLCGVEALSQALSIDVLSREASADAQCSRKQNLPLPPVHHLAQMRDRFLSVQQERQLRGAMHCALYVDQAGNTRLCREDIGRHNALDKLLGACLAEGLDLQHGFVAVTSRCSLELIQKSVRASVGTLVTLSSPSDISVRWARRYRLNLVHQPKDDMPRIYSGSR
ncbi:formate dehydrogenase accessory sulfurtransferase FdhD [Microbulbifer sp. ALW1]|uniref:formate dehydrogenase accessory sulfurtransferase FdhD n=1 Tax=Microbulbifer sp. (strain ALW1) TaxID=1516059 RepID=UPI001358A5C1|nr:formate dehydrogenase accessory sulfurtransferase FdhD [Microbulbifer sp. ALW1]